jgi:hypothetical protein
MTHPDDHQNDLDLSGVAKPMLAHEYQFAACFHNLRFLRELFPSSRLILSPIKGMFGHERTQGGCSFG